MDAVLGFLNSAGPIVKLISSVLSAIGALATGNVPGVLSAIINVGNAAGQAGLSA